MWLPNDDTFTFEGINKPGHILSRCLYLRP